MGKWFHNLHLPPAALLQQGHGAGGSRSSSVQALQSLPCPPSTLPLLYLFMFEQKHNTNKAWP